jgi:nucleotide-binding universal stress UspA family protein
MGASSRSRARRRSARIPRYRRVLVSTDFSEIGDAAIPHAYALLGSGPGTVVICHVFERPPLPNPLYAHYSPGPAPSAAERRALARRLAERLRGAIPERVPRGVETRVRVVDAVGPVHEAICELARSVRADAIVIASHGHSGLARLLLGTTAERVLRHARRPVLVVRS